MVEQQTTAGSDRIRSLYSTGKTYSLVYIITHDYSTIEFRNLWRQSPASLRRGGAGPLHTPVYVFISMSSFKKS